MQEGCYGCGEREIKFLTIRIISGAAMRWQEGWSAQIHPRRILENRTRAKLTDANVSHRSVNAVTIYGAQIALVM